MSRDENVLLARIPRARASQEDEAAAPARLPRSRGWWNDVCRSTIEAWAAVSVCPGYHLVLADD